MFKWISGRLGCMAGRHERSQAKAFKRAGADRYESVCVYCGTPMLRLGKRNWVVKRTHIDA